MLFCKRTVCSRASSLLSDEPVKCMLLHIGTLSPCGANFVSARPCANSKNSKVASFRALLQGAYRLSPGETPNSLLHAARERKMERQQARDQDRETDRDRKRQSERDSVCAPVFLHM